MTALWVLGISLSLLASVFGSVGKVCLKLAHSSKNAAVVQLVASLCVFLLNPVFDAWSYAYAAQSILAPMAGCSVAFNMVLAPAILGEKLSPRDVRGTFIIVLGCVLVGISGNHDTPHHSSHEIYRLFAGSTFVQYTVLEVFAVGGLIWSICALKVDSQWRRFAYGALSGTIGGNLFFLKSAVELGSDPDAWRHAEFYLLIVAAVGASGGGIYLLNRGLKQYEALYLVSVYQAFLIIIGSISGMVFFHESVGITTWWQMYLYPAAIMTTVAGIVLLSEKDSATHEESEKCLAIHIEMIDESRQPTITAKRPSTYGAISPA